jgi:hypothetical protein
MDYAILSMYLTIYSVYLHLFLHLSTLFLCLSFSTNKPWIFNTRAQCYKTFYVCNLRIFAISYSVCPWQAFPALSNGCLVKQEPTLLKNFSGAPLSGKLLAMPTNNAQAEKLCQGQTLSLITNFFYLRTKEVL